MTEPTYLDVTDEQVAAIAAQLGTTVEAMLADQDAELREELSKQLGMMVDKILEGADGELVAKIKPATDEALDLVKEDTSDTKKVIGGALAGLTVILGSALGLRGRRKRAKEEGTS
jgi:hypothetical protein